MLYPHSVTIMAPQPVTDEYSDPALSTDTAIPTVSPAWVQQRSTSEVRTDARNAVVSGWVVFLPATTKLEPDYLIKWGDLTFEVDGLPNLLYSPDGAHHMEATLRIVEG